LVFRNPRENPALAKKIDLLQQVIDEQEADLETLKSFVKKLHLNSLRHAHLMQHVRSSLVRVVHTLDSAYSILNTTKIKATVLESLKLRVSQRERLEKILSEAKIDYETGMVKTSKGATNVSIDKMLDELKNLTSYEKGRGGKERMVTNLADPALMFTDIDLLLSILLLIGAAALGGICFQMAGLNETIGYVIGGVVAGPSGLNLILELGTVQTLASIGSIFAFFSHGMRLRKDIEALKENKQSLSPSKTFTMATVHMLATSVITGSLILASGLADSIFEGLTIGIAFGSSSLSMASDSTKSSKLHKSPYLLSPNPSRKKDSVPTKDSKTNQPVTMLRRQLHLSTLATALAVSSDGVVSIILSVPADTNAWMHAVVGFSTVVATAVLVEHFRLIKHLFLMLTARSQNAIQSRTLSGAQLRALVPVALCLASAYITRVPLGLSLEIGAFVSGFCMARTMSIEMGTLGTVFGGLMFASIGTIVDLNFILRNAHAVCISILAVYVIKTVSASIILGAFDALGKKKIIEEISSVEKNEGQTRTETLFSRCLTKMRVKPVIVILASSLSGIGELSLIFLGQAQATNVITRRNYLLCLAIVVLSSFVLPTLHAFLIIGDRTRLLRRLAGSRNVGRSRADAASADAELGLPCVSKQA